MKYGTTARDEERAEETLVFQGTVSGDGKINTPRGSLLGKIGIDSRSDPSDLTLDDLVRCSPKSQSGFLRKALKQALAGSVSRTEIGCSFSDRTRAFVEFVFVREDGEGPGSARLFGFDSSGLLDSLAAFRRRADFFETAADSAGIGFWFWHVETGEYYSTPACNRFFGLEIDDRLTPARFREKVFPDDSARVNEILNESMATGKPFDLQCRLLHDDGHVLWIASRGSIFAGSKPGQGIFLGTVQNINELKAVNKELERINRLERKARDQAENATSTKDYFVTLVSHELRSPLNSILGWTKVLLNNDVDEETKQKALKTIERSSRAQAKLIEDLLDSAGITSGKLNLELRRLNAFHILENVVDSHLPQIEKNGIKFEFEHDDEEGFVLADSARLRQVFANLLGNAIKFTPEGESIRCSMKTEGEDLVVVISDTGRGIRKEYLPAIFERFKQAHDIPPGKTKGLGLGLSIVKILVEKHGGTVEAESEGKGKGSTFTVRLPIAGEEAEPTEAHAEISTPVDTAPDTSLKGIRILIVEDDADSRKVLGIFLRQTGAVVKSAPSVSGAFELLEKEDAELPHVIISDIGMPDEDGFAFIEKLHESTEFKEIPVIALSAFSSNDYKRRAAEAGFSIYHTKPFAPNKLCLEILGLVEQPGRE